MKMLSSALLMFGIFLSMEHGDCSSITWTNPSSGTGTITPAIHEGAAIGTTGYTVTATSDGTPSAVTLTIEAGSGLFSIASGLISTAAVLDYETENIHVIYIKAVDNNAGAAATSTATLTVSVTNVDTDPVFSALSYCVVIPHLSAVGTTLTTLSAAKNPGAATLTYSLASASNTNTDFTVGAGGVVTTLNLMDRTVRHVYGLVLYAANDVPITATSTLFICVGDTSQCSACSTCSGSSVISKVGVMPILALLLLHLR